MRLAANTSPSPYHFAFNAEERFLPVYQFAEPNNKRVTHLDDFAEKFLAKCTLSGESQKLDAAELWGHYAENLS